MLWSFSFQMQLGRIAYCRFHKNLALLPFFYRNGFFLLNLFILLDVVSGCGVPVTCPLHCPVLSVVVKPKLLLHINMYNRVQLQKSNKQHIKSS